MRILTLTPIVFLFLCLTLHPSAKAEVADRIVAVVNDDIITLSEVNEEGAPYFQALIKQVPTERLQGEMQRLRKEVLSHLIDQHLIEQQAAKLEIKISDEELNQAIAAMLAEGHASKEDLKKELESKGLTEAQYRNQFRGQMLQSRVISREIRSKVVITDEKINQYYKENYTAQPGDASSGYHILQIGFKWGDEYKQKTAAEARQAAENAKKELDGGKPFAEVATALSDLPSKVDGGDLGVFQPQELAPFMKEIILGLKPGETSGIIETPTGYQILKLVTAKDGDHSSGAPPLVEVKKEIEEKLYKQEGEQLFKKWISDLRTKAFIKENP